MKKNVWQTLDSYLCMQEDLEKDKGHSLVLVLRKKWCSISEDSPKGIWDKIAERTLLEFAESGCPIFRATTPLSRGSIQKHRTWKTVDTLCSRPGNVEGATSYLHGKYGVEIRIWSLKRDNTHSWVRISHGSNKFVMNLNNNETDIPEDQLEEYALKLSAKDFACRSKATAKPQRREPAGSSPRIVSIEKRNWIDSEPGKYSLSEYDVSKKVIHLLRHSQKVHREEDGAVHFWRMKENLQSHFPQSIHWSDARWKACLAAGGGGGVKRRFQYCTDDSGTIVYFRALQGHSGRNLIDPSLQDNVVIPGNFFQHKNHIGCAFNLHSVINNGLIPGSPSSSKRQTVFFLPGDPMDKSHKDPDVIDLSVPRHALLSDSIECYHPSRNTSSLLYSESCQDEDWRSLKWESIHVTSTSAKDLIETRMEKRIRFRTRSTCRSWQLSRSFQSNQPTLNPIRERSRRLEITHDVIGVQDERETSRPQEIDDDSLREEPSSSERTGRLVTGPVPGKPVHETV